MSTPSTTGQCRQPGWEWVCEKGLRLRPQGPSRPPLGEELFTDPARVLGRRHGVSHGSRVGEDLVVVAALRRHEARMLGCAVEGVAAREEARRGRRWKNLSLLLNRAGPGRAIMLEEVTTLLRRSEACFSIKQAQPAAAASQPPIRPGCVQTAVTRTGRAVHGPCDDRLGCHSAGTATWGHLKCGQVDEEPDLI